MFSASAIPAILQTKGDGTVNSKSLARPFTSTTSLFEDGLYGTTTRTRERTVASMSKRRIRQAQDSTLDSAEAVAQAPDLVMLYEKFKRPIHTYIYHLLGSQEDADDLTQEVFMRAFVSWSELHDRNNLSSWLYRIATNLCVDMLRRRKRISWWPLARRRSNSQQYDPISEDDFSYLPPDTGGIPEVFERDHIRLALAGMPEDYAVALILSASQGIPYQDIATIVGISANAAATRVSRAKRMFAEQYQRLNEEENMEREEKK